MMMLDAVYSAVESIGYRLQWWKIVVLSLYEMLYEMKWNEVWLYEDWLYEMKCCHCIQAEACCMQCKKVKSNQIICMYVCMYACMHSMYLFI